MSRFQKFEKAYNEAIDSITLMLSDEDDVGLLANWLMDTDHNPYSFLPEAWAGAMGTAEGFASLLHMIHHALVDDGDISFPVVNGEPRIAFVWKHEDNARDYILTNQEKQMDTDGRMRAWRGLNPEESMYEITWLESVSEFIEQRDLYQAAEIKRWFANDAEIHGVDFAVKHYSSYKQFDSKWIDEVKDEIDE